MYSSMGWDPSLKVCFELVDVQKIVWVIGQPNTRSPYDAGLGRCFSTGGLNCLQQASKQSYANDLTFSNCNVGWNPTNLNKVYRESHSPNLRRF